MNKPYINRTTPYELYRYARDTLKGRWPEAEPIIAKKGPIASQLYTKVVIKQNCYWIKIL